MDYTQIIPVHFGQEYANQTLDWLPTDTKENYDRLVQDSGHRKYFADLGWDQPGAITYKFNSHGFRADEFDGSDCMISLGCSYTVGIGLPLEVTWAYQTSRALNLKSANLAWGGYSADTCYRLAEYWIPKLKPKYVCMLVPPKHRNELLLEASLLKTKQIPFEVFMPQTESNLFNENDNYIKHWFLNSQNAEINQRKNIKAIKYMCAELNIPCTIYNAEDHMWWSRDEIGYARDFMHGGPKIHNVLAEKFINAYKK